MYWSFEQLSFIFVVKGTNLLSGKSLRIKNRPVTLWVFIKEYVSNAPLTSYEMRTWIKASVLQLPVALSTYSLI